MKLLSSTRCTKRLLILLPLLVSLACKFVTGGSDTVIPAPAVIRIPQDVTFGAGPFSLTDMQAGLADLSSYKATLTYSFDGVVAGNTEQWSKTYVMLTKREPAARQLTIETTGGVPELETVFMAEADGTSYEHLPGGACTASVIEQGNSFADWLEPAGLLISVIGADEAGGETVNDVAANHYTFDERALGGADISKSTGEMWVASEGGFIVKYLLTTSGDADYLGEGKEGTLTWDYQLTDINQSVSFDLPKDCPPGLVDAPLLPDAVNVLNMPSMLSYDTSASVKDAAAFYTEQIPDLGCEVVDEPSITDTTAMLEFTHEDQTMTVIITANDGVTIVRIVLSHSQVLEQP